MKKIFLTSLIFIIFLSCEQHPKETGIIGSWYRIKKSTYADRDSIGNTTDTWYIYEELHFEESIFFVYSDFEIDGMTRDYFIRNDSLYYTHEGTPYLYSKILEFNEKVLKITYPEGNSTFHRIPSSEDDLGDYYTYDEEFKYVIQTKDIKPYWVTFQKRRKEKIAEFKKNDN